MPLPDEVVQSFPEEIRNEPSLQKFNDVGSIAKSYLEIEKLNGNAVQLPKKDFTPEQLTEWKEKQFPKIAPHLPALGFDLPPPSADKYAIQKPEGYTLDEGTEKVVREFAFKNGLSNKVVQGLIELHHGINQQMMNEVMVKPEAAEAEARELAGADWDSINSLAQAGLESVKAANPDVGDFFEKAMLVEILPDGRSKAYPLGKHPNIIGLLSLMGELTAADQGGNAGKGGSSLDQTADEAEKEARDIMFNKENPKYKVYHGQSSVERTEMREYVNRLLAKKHPGETTI